MIKYSFFLSFLCSIILSSSIIECIEHSGNPIGMSLDEENSIDILNINLGGFHLQKNNKLSNSIPLKSINHFMEKSKNLHRRSDLSEIKRASSSTIHEVIFSIKQNNLDKLKDVLYSVSDPQSKLYGKHRTRAQVAEITSNPISTSATISYLKNNGVEILKQTSFGEYITVTARISTWEKMFNTEFFQYKQNNNGIKYLRAKEYSLPSELHSHVSSVFKTVQHPDLVRPFKKFTNGEQKKKTSSLTTSSSSCVNNAAYNQVEPAFLNCYHDIPHNDGLNHGSQALYEGLNQSYSAGDLATFQNAFNLPLEEIAVDIGGHVYPYACPDADINNCAEANLDVQYMMAIAQNISTTYYYDNGDWVEWITSVADMTDPPLVFSISYSGYEEFISTSYTQSFDIEAMKLGIMGVTIFSASGDDGVAGYIARDDPKWCGYNPQFPATSPYVTSVGASQGPESNQPDIACQSNEGGVITTGKC
jgi:tripeptidyl-peptidase-1